MGEMLDEFTDKLNEILAIRLNIYLTPEQKEEQEEYLWRVVQKIWKGMGPIETECAADILADLWPF